jgi:hypothetical protein
MSISQYNKIANICIAIVIVAAFLSDSFPAYKVHLGTLAVLAATMAAINYFRNQWVVAQEVESAWNESVETSADKQSFMPSSVGGVATGVAERALAAAQVHDEIIDGSILPPMSSNGAAFIAGHSIELSDAAITRALCLELLQSEILAAEELTQYLHNQLARSSSMFMVTDSFSSNRVAPQWLRAPGNKVKGKGKPIGFNFSNANGTSDMLVA